MNTFSSTDRNIYFFRLWLLMRICSKNRQIAVVDRGSNSPLQITAQVRDALRRYKKFIVVGQLVYHNP